MKVAIDKIKVGERFRKHLGDLQAFAQNIKERDLLHSIVVDTDHNLVAGRRRLEACKLLGWDQIDVTRISLEPGEAILIERDENV